MGPQSEPGSGDVVVVRRFNRSGPVAERKHYLIPPLDRIDLAEVRELIDEQQYFVLHAPRQTGKTSALLALRGLLNAEGRYGCVYVNVEGAMTAREDVGAAIRTVLSELGEEAHDVLGDGFLAETWPPVLAKGGGHSALRVALTRWARKSERPLVLLVDEIDTLMGDSLLAVLRQLRAGYYKRPSGFPHSVILCGVRDVRDYRIYSSSEKTMVTGGSAFNIKAESLRLGDFSRDEACTLLGQHTDETGQPFTEDALDAIWTQTQGQPWLVNALAYETCFRGDLAKDRSRAVTEADVLNAREELILRRDTHLDQLTDKLKEGRVWRVIEPLLTGARESTYTERDVEYVRDLGLIARDPPIRMANPIYAEVVPRELTWLAQDDLLHDPAWYVDASGALRLGKLLEAFQEFYRENSEHWVERYGLKEAGPQLLLQAFLQRVVNSGGRIEREYALGSGRTDLLIVWPEGERVRKHVVECKVRHDRWGLERTVAEGVKQTAAYMDRCGAEAGHLVVFDRSEERSWDEKVFRDVRRAETVRTTEDARTTESGVEIAVWGM